jgi:4-hydroxy-tetrahydrodipicolinate synthase
MYYKIKWTFSSSDTHMEKLVLGTYAAVVTPRRQDHSIDEASLRSWLEFLIKAGMKGFAINGATGEFCLTTEYEFQLLAEIVADSVKGRAAVIAGIGGAGTAEVIRRGQIAIKTGVDAVLLPMPYFFPYSQDDLAAFTTSVAGELESPVLLYNLPQFTSGLEPETTLGLIQRCRNIVGIKDSSGSLETVRLLSVESPEACRIIGNDGVLAQALRERLADGVISGVACVLPELISQIFEIGKTDPDSPRWNTMITILDEFIAQLDIMPTPWGIKIMAEARGIAKASFPLPLSERRQYLAQELSTWFTQNKVSLSVAGNHM